MRQALEEVHELDLGVGLLLIDIDRFKQINDTFGHDVGDCALYTVSKTLRNCLRPTDVIARWGGEEFVVLAMRMRRELLELRKIAERCRMLIANSRVSVGHNRVSVTVSMGGTFLLATDTGETAMRRADELLYKSKENGRNQIHLS